MGRVLYFEGAGCDGTQVNDVENCRIRTAFKTDDGREFYLELFSGCENYRHGEIPYGLQTLSGTEKKYHEHKWDRKYTYYTTFDNMIVVDFCFQIFNGNGDCNSFRHEIERKRTALPYTKENILKLVNENLGCSFTEVKVLPWLAGYRVHSGKAKRKYNLMDDYIDIPARTAERERIYNEVAHEYFNNIYERHCKANPFARKLMSKYRTYSLVKLTDKTITIRSHTYKQLIDDSERIKTWRVNY